MNFITELYNLRKFKKKENAYLVYRVIEKLIRKIYL